MTPTEQPLTLSRRERQVMDILHRCGEATVAEIMAELPDPPTYSAVRSIVRILAEKGRIRHREDGPRYVYSPAVDADAVRETALSHLVDTYFGGSPEQAVTALLRSRDLGLADDEVATLRAAIERARARGR
jgi:BlaI family transcriptional regulator, penicillinase repressor